MNENINDPNISVHLDDELKKHFYQSPNLIYEIKGLKSHERDVYNFLTRIGNQGQACWMSHNQMAKTLGMSARKLHDVKNTLASPFPEIENQPLIFINYRKKKGTKENLTSEIFINGHIWKVSFKKSLGGAGDAGGVPQDMQEGTAGGAGKEYYPKNTKDLSKDRSKDVAGAPRSSFSSDSEKLCEILVGKIQSHGVKFKDPRQSKKTWTSWILDMNKLFRLTQVTPQEVEEMINYAHGNDFWCQNILSPAKLRKHWSQLSLQKAKRKLSTAQIDEYNQEISAKLIKSLTEAAQRGEIDKKLASILVVRTEYKYLELGVKGSSHMKKEIYYTSRDFMAELKVFLNRFKLEKYLT